MPHVTLAGFEMTVLGYEFPDTDPAQSFYDANWLFVEAKIGSDDGFIHLKKDACLLTSELHDLVGQLEFFVKPQGHRRWRAELRTMEPYLKIHLEQDQDSGLIFAAELRVDAGRTIQEFRVQWDIDQDQLEELHRQLSRLSQQFPIKTAKENP
ncbi:hypothetical protein QOL99_03055 [Deinococcus sp. MIMF12]|uniref:Uncharacterized protein n=1 Tax=Deinococcus rhizophilus TaxID=3049544 RepID=A0ABT7JDJ1_9DEIO|nr:hypothetical protein [Deinococcus rhizophilus]MDL2343123.1 hypothetical protein [Deinococcus rhizophilus]